MTETRCATMKPPITIRAFMNLASRASIPRFAPCATTTRSPMMTPIATSTPNRWMGSPPISNRCPLKNGINLPGTLEGSRAPPAGPGRAKLALPPAIYPGAQGSRPPRDGVGRAKLVLPPAICAGSAKAKDDVSLAVGVVAGADHGAGLDVGEAHREGLGLGCGDLFGRSKARDGEVLGGW